MRPAKLILLLFASVAAGVFPVLPLLANETQPVARHAAASDSTPFRISEQGCGRATGYVEANKIITTGDRTHVAWLDSSSEGFRVRVRSWDRTNGKWSPTYTVGQAYDNHGGPALTIDSKGFLHIAYYPHHHAMRYRKSKRPRDVSEWEDEVQFGERLTYPTMVCGKDDTLYLTARRSYSDRPWRVELWSRRPGDSWKRAGAILSSRHPGYAHFQESLAWGPDHQTLHLCCRFHEKSDGGAYGRLQTVAYLVSPDAGKTWQRSDGATISLPATPESAEVLASGGVDQERALRAGAMAVDAQGRPHVVYSLGEEGRSQLVVARSMGKGEWQRWELSEFVDARWSSWKLTAPAGMAFDSQGQMMVTAQIQKPAQGESGWGHPTDEVVLFSSSSTPAAVRSFSFGLVSPPDLKRSHWLPNLERATGHNRVPAGAGILYTAGGPGEKNTELLSNEVFFTTAISD